MTIQDYIICFLVAILGQVIQTALKLNSLQKKATVGNTGLNVLNEYFRNDYWAIVANLAFIAACLFIATEWLMSEYILGKIKTGFLFIGWAGSDLANRLFTKTNQKINEIIDRKTDKADGV
jgi:hypothetical protein